MVYPDWEIEMLGMLGTYTPVWLSMVGIVNKFSSVKTDLKWLFRAL